MEKLSHQDTHMDFTELHHITFQKVLLGLLPSAGREHLFPHILTGTFWWLAAVFP